MALVRIGIVMAFLAVTAGSAVSAPECVTGAGVSGTVSLDCQGEDVVPVYEYLAGVGGYNIVIHTSVRGRVTLRLSDVRWDQALEMITSLMGHGMRFNGNTIYISLMGEGW
jgi:type II secretory pathway component HofQ